MRNSLTPEQIEWAYQQWLKGTTRLELANSLNVSKSTIDRVIREKAKPNKNQMKSCKICGRQFVPATYNQLCCSPFCTEENARLLALENHRKQQAAKAVTARKRAYSLSYITAEIAAYNKKHGTHLTYGKYVSMKERGLLDNGN